MHDEDPRGTAGCRADLSLWLRLRGALPVRAAGTNTWWVEKSRAYGALAGIAAAAVAVGIAELIAVGTGARSAPLIAVGGVVVDAVPESLKSFAISLFGTHDKTALLIGTGVLLAAFAALIGVVAVRNLAYGFAGVGVFAAVGVAAALTRPHAGLVTTLPSLVGAVAAAVVLWFFVEDPLALFAGRPVGAPRRERVSPGAASDWAREARGGTPLHDHGVPEVATGDQGGHDHEAAWPEDRRRFLTAVGVVVGAAAAGGFAGRWLSGRRGVAVARSEVALPTPAALPPTVPPAADLNLAQLTPYVTPNATFYRIDTALVVPQVDPATWQLRIHGRVRNPITLTFADLLKRPMVERYVTLACVSNEVGGDLIGNARWLGAPLKDLLEEAGPLDGADQVVGRSVDGFTCGTPTGVMTDGRDALLAVGMNGEPLPIEHGFPVRVVVPGLYGYVSACKWVSELELTSFADFDAYWVPRGWSAQAPIKTESRIDTPRGRNKLTAGPVTVAGVAWAQHRGIGKVEVQVDGGPWNVATLARAVSIDTWVQWSWRWDAPRGDHQLRVRATDATGETQPSQPRPPEPNGAQGWHTVSVAVG
jgi:DMSO/TMAO reductase YedYZ molybdopterin-dependent catalytic subunit